MLLRRVTKHITDQNWFAVFLDFIIVVAGVFIGIQVANWNEVRQQNALENSYLMRLAGDLEETIDLLQSKDELAMDSKSLIQASLNTLNDIEASDKDLVHAVQEYITEGTSLLGFYVSRTTFDDLQSTGNLSVLKNKELIASLGQLHRDFSYHDIDSLVNTDWVLPLESEIVSVFDYMRFDVRTEHLFPNKTDSEIVGHIRDNYDLIQRHAAMHYWYLDAISEDYKSASSETRKVLNQIKLELESSK
ncbi:MAG: DUF6090 family protein [Proteobacteria bacterium]|nr:DUF6090 family protein [Pseudomonadota bacterium]